MKLDYDKCQKCLDTIFYRKVLSTNNTNSESPSST
jgi:hypothetical protein